MPGRSHFRYNLQVSAPAAVVARIRTQSFGNATADRLVRALVYEPAHRSWASTATTVHPMTTTECSAFGDALEAAGVPRIHLHAWAGRWAKMFEWAP